MWQKSITWGRVRYSQDPAFSLTAQCCFGILSILKKVPNESKACLVFFPGKYSANSYFVMQVLTAIRSSELQPFQAAFALVKDHLEKGGKRSRSTAFGLTTTAKSREEWHSQTRHYYWNGSVVMDLQLLHFPISSDVLSVSTPALPH